MKTFTLFLPLAAVLMPAFVHGCDCHLSVETAPSAASSVSVEETKPTGHPLKGVIIDVLPDQSALLVKHEEIPSVMKAMTMLLKVDADALASVKKGDAVTGLLVSKTDGWWLDAVKVIK